MSIHVHNTFGKCRRGLAKQLPSSIPSNTTAMDSFSRSDPPYSKMSMPNQIRPGSLVVTSWTIHTFPSGSLKEQYDP
jgi:hypothetical protein